MTSILLTEMLIRQPCFFFQGYFFQRRSIWVPPRLEGPSDRNIEHSYAAVPKLFQSRHLCDPVDITDVVDVYKSQSSLASTRKDAQTLAGLEAVESWPRETFDRSSCLETLQKLRLNLTYPYNQRGRYGQKQVDIHHIYVDLNNGNSWA